MLIYANSFLPLQYIKNLSSSDFTTFLTDFIASFYALGFLRYLGRDNTVVDINDSNIIHQ